VQKSNTIRYLGAAIESRNVKLQKRVNPGLATMWGNQYSTATAPNVTSVFQL
jgi:hypothetical protein